MYKKILNKLNSIIRIYRNNKIVDDLVKQIELEKSKKRFFLFQTPTHTNIGDHAIAESQLVFLTENFPNHTVFEINQSQMEYFIKKYKRHIIQSDIILIHGGGNFGNEYMREEKLRRLVVESFPNNKIILFPQTIFYSDNDIGNNEIRNTQNIFNKHTNLVLTAREETSYELMKKYFPKNKVILTPDIVLYTTFIYENKRDYALEVIRGDQESILSNGDKMAISRILSENINKKINSDMHCEKIVDLNIKNIRKRIYHDKLFQFSRAKVVITDRLHGMVLATITGTPCIVFSNYNQKVLGTYSWIKDLEYIKFVSNVEEAKNALNELLKLEDYQKYNSSKLKKLYTPLIDVIND